MPGTVGFCCLISHSPEIRALLVLILHMRKKTGKQKQNSWVAQIKQTVIGLAIAVTEVPHRVQSAAILEL